MLRHLYKSVILLATLLASHFPTGIDSLGDATPSIITQYAIPFDTLTNILATGVSEQVMSDTGVLEIASFDWSVLQADTLSPFIVCVENGRQGVVRLLDTIPSRSKEPLWSSGKLNCYMAHISPVDTTTIKNNVPSLKYMMPMSPLYAISGGLIDDILGGRLLKDLSKCKNTHVSLHTSPGFINQNGLISNIKRDLGSFALLANALRYLFYWVATQSLTTYEKPPKGLRWEQSVSNVLSQLCTCDFSNLVVRQESSLVIVENICAFNTNSACASNCVLTLLAYLSTLQEVVSLSVTGPLEQHNINSARIMQSGNSSTVNHPFWKAGLNGTGLINQVLDTGLDVNNCYFKDSTAVPSSTLAAPVTNLTIRKCVQNVVMPGAVPYDADGHGTHVAGTVGGYAVGTTPGVNTFNGNAFGTKIAFVAFNKADGTLVGFGNWSNILIVGYQIGVRIHSASLGISYPPSGNSYDLAAYTSDQFLYYQPESAYFVSAANNGNIGLNTRSIASPSSAKNVVCVGSNQNYLGNYGPNFNNIANISRVAYYSSIGPVTQGRMKPDILAPGQMVDSAKVNTTCNTQLLQGTSMSCPNAAGMGTIIRQYYLDGFYPTGIRTPANAMTNPSGALIKATLINSAVGVTSYQNSRTSNTASDGFPIGPPPDIYQGWGRIQLSRTLRLNNAEYPILYVQDYVSMTEGQTRTYKFTIPSLSKVMSEFEVTITWYDPPTSIASGGRVVNNIDMTATLDSDPKRKLIYPNGLIGPDNVNNVEKIRLANPMLNDVITIKLTGTTIAVTSSQNLAMVVNGVYVPAAWYCQDPRSIRPDALYRTENCRRACQAFKRNPICCQANAGDTCTPASASDAFCVGLTKPSNC